MTKQLDYNAKEKLTKLAATCFWYWDNLYSFLESCGVNRSTYNSCGKDNKYVAMRCILEKLTLNKQYDIIQKIAIGFCGLKSFSDKVNRKKALELINEFKKTNGNSFIEDEFKSKKFKESVEIEREKNKQSQLHAQQIIDLRNKFLALQTHSDDKQKRGYELETLFYELLTIEEFEFNSPYKAPGEQIDGYFKHEKFDYLVEIKWTEESANQADLSIFDGKIRGKAQSTRGLFLSINAFNPNAITKYSGDSPRIILLDGGDLYNILDQRVTFYDLMRFKIDHLVRKGEIFVRWST